jgi:cell division protein FtsZ
MSCRGCIVGIGGGGCKIADRVALLSPSGISTIAIDTDSRSLLNSHATTKLEIGFDQTHGRGTGGDANLGMLSAKDEIEMIRNLFTGMDLVMVIAGLGCGTGSGAAPIVLRAARDAGAMVLCFATLPFDFEGERKRTQAARALEPLHDSADALIVITNDKLLESAGETSIAAAFGKTDEVLGSGVYAILKAVSDAEYISVDLSDLKRMITNCGGTCVFGYGNGTGAKKAAKAADNLLRSSVMAGGEVVANAHALFVSILGGKDLAIAEVRGIREAILARTSKDCSVSLGTVVDDAWQNQVSIVVLASEHRISRPDNESATTGGTTAKRPSGKADRASKKQSKSGQTQLSFEASSRGRFKDAVPTVMDGEDLDIPTFIRRGIAIEK